MESNKKQFDELLGGAEKLPREAHILKLAAARACEISAMTHSLENPHQTKLIFQKLPIHMRRRVMSHNVKRMPRKLRSGHLQQMLKSGLPPKSKRPSRKYRRRPRNLLEEYNRRKRKSFWLETHIWHAKRFKMIDKWGHKIPYHPNDRCFRACYRSIKNHCLIQDISYVTCVEIMGPIDILKCNLDMHCNPNELTFSAKTFLSGQREGMLMFYKNKGYPKLPIGYVDFLWKSSDSNLKSIWIWVHPSFYSEVIKELESTFNFTLLNINEDHLRKKVASNPEYVNIPLNILKDAKVPRYNNNCGCSMTILKNCVNRFKLTGPMAARVLHDSLKVPNLKPNFKDDEQENNNIEMSSSEISNQWYNSYYKSKENQQNFKQQKDTFECFKHLKSPNQLPPKMVLGLTVLDPRFFLISKKSKSISTDPVQELRSIPQNKISKSPIWEESVQTLLSAKLMTISEINNLRSQNMVPGVANDNLYDQEKMHKIPILIIQKPGHYSSHDRIGYGSAIDVILPAGWAMPFWMAFILRCARPGGFREAKTIPFECSTFNDSNVNHPDTKSYQRDAAEEKEKLTKIYFKRPPNKRVSYVKYGITSPFFCEWKILMKEWNSHRDFYVLRDWKKLQILNQSLIARSDMTRKVPVSQEINCNVDDLVSEKNCLVPVKVSTLRKGMVHNFSIICLPTEEDIEKFKTCKSWSGPVQKALSDTNKNYRKKLRADHQSLLKRLRRQRIKAREKMEKNISSASAASPSQAMAISKMRCLVKKKLINKTKPLKEEYAQRMAELYLPKCITVRNSCDREVLGYVTQGGFLYSEAKGIGLGYVVLLPLIKLIKQNCNYILVRNPTTKQFRMCRIEILS